ncbi:MAG: lysylphosphatidylglycerol synthase transmembrane domain-containing protein [Ignavibacteria bacterium]
MFFTVTILIQFSFKSNFTEIANLISDIDFTLLLIIIPVIFITLFETFGWYLTLNTKNEKINFTQLYLLRTAIDSVQNSIPGGFAAAELLRPVMLRRNFGMPMNRAVASGIITKLNIAIAQVLFIITGIAVMLIFYSKESAYFENIGYKSIYISLASLIAAIFCLTIFLYKYNGLTKIFNYLKSLNIKRLKKLLLRNEDKIYEINNYMREFNTGNIKNFIYTIFIFYVGWMIIAAEAFLIFRIIGVDLNFSQAIILESAASLIRIVFFFLPSGMGAQEAGLLGLMSAMGFADPISASVLFSISRRTKEIVWVIFGYILLFRFGLNPLKLYLSKFRKELKRRKVELLFSESE